MSLLGLLESRRPVNWSRQFFRSCEFKEALPRSVPFSFQCNLMHRELYCQIKYLFSFVKKSCGVMRIVRKQVKDMLLLFVLSPCYYFEYTRCHLSCHQQDGLNLHDR